MIPKPFLRTLCRLVYIHGLPVMREFTDAFLIALLESGLPNFKELAVNIFAGASFNQFVKALQVVLSIRKDLAEVIAADERHLAQSHYVLWLA